MPDDTYQLLDSGHGAKLERFADVCLHRPSPQALWGRQNASAWGAADAIFERDSKGGGKWTVRGTVPASWNVQLAGLRFMLKTTGFGHVGLFPEQAPSWIALQDICNSDDRVLNLFGYTGGSTLACARAGAAVTHCDASKGILEWGRENATLNQLEGASIRWILDDAVKFTRREGRRQREYHGIIMDPPSFGRGPKGEVFKLEQELPSLLRDAAALLSDDAKFFLLSGHTPGIGALAMRNLLAEVVSERGGTLLHGEMSVPQAAGQVALPSGVFAVWTADHAAWPRG